MQHVFRAKIMCGWRLDLINGSLNDVPVGLWMWDVVADRVFADTFLARYFGVDAQDAAAGLPLKAYLANVHEMDREHTHRAILEAVERGGDFRHSYRVQNDTGNWRRITAVGNCFLQEGNRAMFPGWIIDLDARDGGDSTGLQNLIVLLSKARDASSPAVTGYALETAIVDLLDMLRNRH